METRMMLKMRKTTCKANKKACIISPSVCPARPIVRQNL
jgi:hypothetical protein